MKKIYCIYCHRIDPEFDENDSEYYIDEKNFVEHLERCHHLKVRSLEDSIKSLKILGMYSEKIVEDTK